LVFSLSALRAGRPERRTGADRMEEFLGRLSGWVWGPVLITLLFFAGVYLTFRLKFIQVRGFKRGVLLIMGRYEEPDEAGDISHFQALCAALSATIGTGNIVGVATAIASGGPGAVFWMWLTAAFGMALKYSSCLLALKYRFIHRDGSVSGGPMYFIEKGLGAKWLGVLFAAFTIIASFGIGNMIQANSVADAIEGALGLFGMSPEVMNLPLSSSPKLAFLTGILLFDLCIGIVIASLVGLVIIGGIKRIAKFASRVVPFMTVVYVGGALAILIMNYDKIGAAFSLIFRDAFSLKAGLGGLIGSTIRYGVARGVFSNEAGLGSAPIAHAAAKTKWPVREGLVAMLGPFVDTLVICTMTALVIITSGLWDSGLDGAALSTAAFKSQLSLWGPLIVAFGLAFFAFTSQISWSYYGDRCAEYLFGPKAIIVYRWIYVLVIPIGAASALKVIWNFADIANGLMAFPNLIGVIGLGGIITAETQTYLSRYKEEKPRKKTQCSMTNLPRNKARK